MRSVYWENGKVVLINQALLPKKFELIRTDDIERLAEAIRLLEVRGAPSIGVAAAYGMVLAAYQTNGMTKEEALEHLEKNALLLKATRPTAINLFSMVDKMMDFAKERLAADDPNLGESMLQEANEIADAEVEASRLQGVYGAELIKDGMSILTHCNCGPLCSVEYGTAVAPMILAHQQGKKIHVYSDETRPRLQGAKLNVWELNEAGVPYTLITDNSAGWVMKQKKIDMVMVGIDRTAANGDSAAKIGVYGVSILAKYHHIPFYAVLPTSTIDMNCPTGDDIPVEERDGDEVRYIDGNLITIPNANVLNYAFDVTSSENITAFITEKGIIYPPFKENFKKLLG